MKIASFVALSFGLALTAWLVSAASLTQIMQSLARVGWGAAVVVAVRASMIVMNGLAWAKLLARLGQTPARIFVVARWIRESVDVLLPAAYVGGGVIGARILTFWHTRAVMAFAGAVADLFLQTLAQAVFALSGALLLLRLIGPQAVLPWLLAGLAVGVAALAGFYVAQRYGGARLIDRTLAMFWPKMALEAHTTRPGFQNAMEEIWNGRRSFVLAAGLMHGIAWLFGTLEVWSTLYFVGWPVTLEKAVVIESLGVSISIAAFVVPGSWGIQEAGYILIGELLGVPVAYSLTLSLVKRIPDFVLGIPGLVVWHAFEARRLFVNNTISGR